MPSNVRKKKARLRMDYGDAGRIKRGPGENRGTAEE
jgi:hypothetical protein